MLENRGRNKVTLIEGECGNGAGMAYSQTKDLPTASKSAAKQIDALITEESSKRARIEKYFSEGWSGLYTAREKIENERKNAPLRSKM